MTRYREIHDFLHVLTGLPPTVEGELALKTLEAVQTGLPMAALSAIAGPLSLRDPRRIAQWYGGAAPAVAAWAAICGQRSVPIHLLVRCEASAFWIASANAAPLLLGLCPLHIADIRMRVHGCHYIGHGPACCRTWKHGCIDH